VSVGRLLVLLSDHFKGDMGADPVLPLLLRCLSTILNTHGSTPAARDALQVMGVGVDVCVCVGVSVYLFVYTSACVCVCVCLCVYVYPY
jgi:hypothetical protein